LSITQILGEKTIFKGALKYACWDSPLGPILLLSNGQGLFRIAINPTLAEYLEQIQNQYQQEIIADKKALARPLKALQEYFQGKRRNFKLDLDLGAATVFQKCVWQTLMKIPYGQVRSYQWVAHQIGVPQGARAVGAANRCNPLPIVIPCHRVIKADGKLGGYSGGIAVKQALLKLEGVRLK